MGKKKKHRDKYDILDFKLIDPVEKGEEWTVLGHRIDKRMAVEICVNNREMLSVVRRIEKHYRPDDALKLNGLGYGHVVPEFLYEELSRASAPGSYAGEHEVYMFVCSDCGEPGCWSVTFHVREDDKAVYWYKFKNEHSDWKYHLKYRFRKDEYKKAMKKLKGMVGAERSGEITWRLLGRVDEDQFESFYTGLLRGLRPVKNEYIYFELGNPARNNKNICYIQTCKNPGDLTWRVEIAQYSGSIMRVYVLTEAPGDKLITVFHDVLVNEAYPDISDWEDMTVEGTGKITDDVCFAAAGNTTELNMRLVNDSITEDMDLVLDLAYALEHGSIFEKNISTARRLYGLAAENGSRDAMLDLGATYQGSDPAYRDTKKAVYWYEKAAETLYPKSFRCLAYALAVPQGCLNTEINEADYRMAFQYYLIGALLGEQNALYEIADMYLTARYVSRDTDLAFRLYERSFESIHDDYRDDSYGNVCYRMGLCYMEGIGTKKDTDAAKVCFDNACLAFEYRKKHEDDERFYASDYKNALFLLDKLKESDERGCRSVFEVYPPVEIAKTDKETEFLDSAAAALKDYEDAYAVTRLAQFYRYGIFVDKNESFADYLDNIAGQCFPEGAG